MIYTYSYFYIELFNSKYTLTERLLRDYKAKKLKRKRKYYKIK